MSDKSYVRTRAAAGQALPRPSSQNDRVTPKSYTSAVLFRQALADFMLYNRAARLTRKTLSFYDYQLTAFARFCADHGVHDLHTVTPAVIRAHLIDLEERQMSDYTIHAAARAIRAFLRFCVREEFIAISPMDKVAMPHVNKQILPAFTPDDIHRLLAACEHERDRAIVLFLLDTGCRVSELVNLNVQDIDITVGEVTIRRGKGRKDRTVFLGRIATDALLAYYCKRGEPTEGLGPVWFSLTRHTRLTLSGAQQLLKRLGRQAGVEHCSPHTFRRTFAIWSLRNGMDIFRLARLMGHADISVLRQYLHLIKEDLRAAHAQYGSVDRLFGEPPQS